MNRSIQIPFNSGSISFTADYADTEELDTPDYVGYLLDDALREGGVIAFKEVISRLNHFCRRLDAGTTTVKASGSSEIEGVVISVTATVELTSDAGDRVDEIKGFLKDTIVRETLSYLVNQATKPRNLPEALSDLLGHLTGRGHSIVDLGDLLGASR